MRLLELIDSPWFVLVVAAALAMIGGAAGVQLERALVRRRRLVRVRRAGSLDGQVLQLLRTTRGR